VVLAAAAGPARAAAQHVAVTELQTGVTGVLAARDFWGAEAGLAWRPGGQLREAVSVALGRSGGAAGVRVRGAAQFVLTPGARAGASPYAGLGLAFVATEYAHGAGYLAVMLGLESAPRRSRGWYVEAGVEGGVRVAAGVRWRRFSRPT